MTQLMENVERVLACIMNCVPLGVRGEHDGNMLPLEGIPEGFAVSRGADHMWWIKLRNHEPILVDMNSVFSFYYADRGDKCMIEYFSWVEQYHNNVDLHPG